VHTQHAGIDNQTRKRASRLILQGKMAEKLRAIHQISQIGSALP
jgi:hypothetical protein